MVVASLALSACAAGSGRDGTYRDPHDRFTVSLPPPRWQPISVDGAGLAFRATTLGAGIGLHADCNGPESGPLPSVARHLFFGLTDKRIEARESVSVSDARGVRTRLHARLDGRPVEVEGVTVRRGACLYDFVYVAPPERFEDGRADFDAFLKSWTPLAAP
jgi:hypothetical protein